MGASKNQMDGLKMVHKVLETKIATVDGKADKACDEVKQNSDMMKEINFAEMKERLRKHKEETDTKLGEMITKLKKKVGSSDLMEL